MPHPENHEGLAPAPAVPSPEGTKGQQPRTPSGSAGIGVPVSIWPHAPVTGSGPGPGCVSCAGAASGPDAAQVITAFSRPGELVVIPAARDGVLAAAGRRVLGLAPGPRSRQRVLACLDGVDPQLRQLAVVRRGGPALFLEAGNPEAGQAALAITGGGGPAPPRACPSGRPGGGEPAAGLGALYAACQRARRPGGVLAVITASTPCPGGLHDDPGEAITRARDAGLIYAQHIVARHAPVCGSQLAPGPEDTARPGQAPGLAAVHVRIHSDLLVFTKPGFPGSSRELKGHQRELKGPACRFSHDDPGVAGELGAAA
jgi:hypothetical protein